MIRIRKPCDCEECQYVSNIDYIYCLTYRGIDNTHEPQEQNPNDRSNLFECKLNQPQRCSQEILDLANFYLMHHHNHGDTIIQKQYSFNSSFSTGIIPLWIELESADQFASVSQFIDCDDVIVLCGKDETDIIRRYCQENNWSIHEDDLRGTEATVIVLYVGIGGIGNSCMTIGYEELTRAKHHLVIVSLRGGQNRYTNNQHVNYLS